LCVANTLAYHFNTKPVTVKRFIVRGLISERFNALMQSNI